MVSVIDGHGPKKKWQNHSIHKNDIKLKRFQCKQNKMRWNFECNWKQCKRFKYIRKTFIHSNRFNASKNSVHFIISALLPSKWYFHVIYRKIEGNLFAIVAYGNFSYDFNAMTSSSTVWNFCLFMHAKNYIPNALRVLLAIIHRSSVFRLFCIFIAWSLSSADEIEIQLSFFFTLCIKIECWI